MTEQFISKKGKRVFFSAGKQREFLFLAQKNLHINWSLFAEKVGVNMRTLTDWKREKYSMPLNVFKKICQLAKISLPADIEIKDRFWYASKGGKISGKKLFEKYGVIGGNQEIRKEKWLSWWKKTGKYNLNYRFRPKKIIEPEISSDLAEFTGIMIGDGGMTERQITITINYKTDRQYIVFIKKLIRKIFRITPKVYYHENDLGAIIAISRTNLVKFCQSIGLKKGNKLKQGLDVPDWVMKRKDFKISCLRGMMDTDGCVYSECHNIRGKKYCYPKMSLVSYSPALRKTIFNIFKGLGFNPVIRNDRSVQLESREDIVKYFKIVKTNNLKHTKRFEMAMGEVG
jgi:hypothetical protein